MAKKKLSCVYLYASKDDQPAFAVEIWEQWHAKSGERIEWAELNTDLKPDLAFDGRLVLHDPDPWYRFLKSCYQIRVMEPKLRNGSDNTKKHGIAVGHLEIRPYKNGSAMWLNRMPDLISDGITHQPDITCSLENIKAEESFGWHRVAL